MHITMMQLAPFLGQLSYQRGGGVIVSARVSKRHQDSVCTSAFNDMLVQG